MQSLIRKRFVVSISKPILTPNEIWKCAAICEFYRVRKEKTTAIYFQL